MSLVLSKETKDRISTVKAALPKPTNDPNVGRVGIPVGGTYKGLSGIIYPPREGIKYIIENGAVFEGNHSELTKDYWVLFFYDDGTFFCGVEADYADLEPSGLVPPFVGDGSPSFPYMCDSLVQGGKGTQSHYHQLPGIVKGFVTIEYDFYTMPDSMDVYYIDNLNQKIASVGSSTGTGKLTFYYDPQFNPTKILVEVSKGISGTGWKYLVRCPK